MKKRLGTTIIALLMLTVMSSFSQHQQGQISVGLSGSAQKLVGGKVDDDMISPSIGLKLGYTIMPELMLTVQGGYGTTFPKDPEKTGDYY